MPFSPEFLLDMLHQFLEACKFYAGKALTAIKPDGRSTASAPNLCGQPLLAAPKWPPPPPGTPRRV